MGMLFHSCTFVIPSKVIDSQYHWIPAAYNFLFFAQLGALSNEESPLQS